MLSKIIFLVIRETAHTNIIKLRPGQHGTFELHFRPIFEGQFKCVVKVHIVNNPFETFAVRNMHSKVFS